MRGEFSSGAYAKRHPYDWYVEPEWVTRQLIDALGGFASEAEAGEVIWDPSAGRGNIGLNFVSHDFRVYLSDIVERVAWEDFDEAALLPHPVPTFFSADFLEVEAAPAPCSIVCNSPYSYCKGSGEYARMLISEAFARHALKLTSRRVCMLLPSKWLSSQSRFALFSEHPPLAVLFLSQRPSMPPGDRIEAMGSRAFRGGMTDYCWIVWDVTRPVAPGQTRAVWLPPLGTTIEPVEGVA